jgi:hypothetical protein
MKMTAFWDIATYRPRGRGLTFQRCVLFPSSGRFIPESCHLKSCISLHIRSQRFLTHFEITSV